MKPEVIENIQGWFDFSDFYWMAAGEVPDGGILVELGPWLGKSTIFLAQSLQNLGKVNARIYAVDTWQGSGGSQWERELFDGIIKGLATPPLESFRQSVLGHGVSGMIQEVVSDSVAAANCFSDGTVDFLFCDTEHTEHWLSLELAAWIPKLKPGALFGGHDIAIPGVRMAVETTLKHWGAVGGCWVSRNP